MHEGTFKVTITNANVWTPRVRFANKSYRQNKKEEKQPHLTFREKKIPKWPIQEECHLQS